jgi:ribosomal protein S18 acetylase RimI-like enzyme
MLNDDTVWRVEEACQNAWPSPRHIMLDGWNLRAAGGIIRRTNSVNPTRGGPRDPTSIVVPAEATYDSLGAPTLFRVLWTTPEMDPVLDRLGYSTEGGTCTLLADFEGLDRQDRSLVELSERAGDDWFAARTAIAGISEAEAKIFRAMTRCILLPTAFAGCRVDGQLVAIAYGALDRDLLVVESVATRPEDRGKGHATRVVGALMDWGMSRGARAACLQVVADNSSALAVYRRLGFRTELHRYHYRRRVGG